MKKGMSVILIIAFLLLTGITAYAGAEKDETVYVILDYDGSVSNIKVVNHLYGFEDQKYLIDYGKYSQIKNLVDNTKPQVSGDIIKWPMNILKEKDLYYEGIMDKKLPIMLNIKYCLNGKDISPNKLAGKDGHLKIDINIKFNEEAKKYNLAAQIQAILNMDVFTNIQSNGTKAVVGKNANLTFMTLSTDKQTFTLEMDGKDIEMEPMTITLIPAYISIPDNIKNDVNAVIDGLDQFENAASKLENGIGETADGTFKMKEGTQKLNKSMETIYDASDKIHKESANIIDGMDKFHRGLGVMSNSVGGKKGESIADGMNKLYGGLNELAGKSGYIQNGIDDLYKGINEINIGAGQLETAADALEANHSQLIQLAQMMQNSPDENTRNMAKGILAEAEAIEAINSGIKSNNKGLKGIESGMQSLSQNYDQYAQGISHIKDNMKVVSDSAGKLSEGLEGLNKNFEEIKQVTGKIFNAYGDINKGLGLIMENTAALPEGLDGLAKGQVGVRNGICELNNDGIGKMRSSLKKNIDPLLTGKNSGDKYTSFVDNEKNKNSTVQFIMRTPSIKKPEEVKKAENIQQSRKSFIEKILDLFR